MAFAQRSAGTGDTAGKKPIRGWVAYGLVGMTAILLASLTVRLVHIQRELRPELMEWSERRLSSTIPLPGRRGMILDRRVRVLAGSHLLPTVFADPRLVEDRAVAAECLAPLLERPAGELRETLEHPTSPAFVILARGIAPETARAIEALKLRGIGTRDEPVRTYPNGPLAAHVLGFVGSDGHGLEGVEMTLDSYLRGKPGRRVVVRDIRRRPVFERPDDYVAPQDGMHVVLTIDVAVQEILEREVQAAVEQYRAEAALGVVLSAKSGEVLALAVAPGFDPAAPGDVPASYRRNRVVTDPMEPGSVFKPFVMAAAIEAGVTHPNEMIHCRNGVHYFGRRRLNDHHPYGLLSVEQILVHSSNIGMAFLGLRLGNEKMHDALKRQGFGEKTGIDLPGESEGMLLPLSQWNSYSTTSVPMGQEVAVTPIQMAAAFCGLVNGGQRVQPHVVAAVLDRNYRLLEDRRPKVALPDAVNPAVSAIMRDILAKVVNEGTGRPCRLEGWQVMGKTGTAQVPWENRRGYEPNAYLGSFMAAAPAHDPEIVVLIMVRKPDRRIGYYGSRVAAPGVRAVLAETLPYLNVPQDPPASEERPEGISLAADQRP